MKSDLNMEKKCYLEFGISSQEIADDNRPSEFSDSKPFDFEMAVKEFGGKSEVVTDLIKNFLIDAETQIKNIAEALKGKDNETIRQEAHKICGAAGSLVAMPLARAAGELEELVRSGQLDRAVEKVKALEQEFTRLKEYV